MCPVLIPCPLCSQPYFNSLESLRIGLIKVATENLTCPICKNVYIGLDKLTIHLFSHCENIIVSANNNNTNRQKLDSEVVSPINDAAHSDEVTNTRLEKKSSENKIQNDVNQKQHVFNMNALPFIGIPKNISNMQNDHNNTKSKILSERCDICGFYFLGKNILQVHKKLIHNSQELENNNSGSKFSCHMCSKTFKMRGSLMVHLRMVHFHTDPSTSKGETDENNDISSTNCNSIAQPFTENNNLTMSNKNEADKLLVVESSNPVSSNKQWKCDICQKRFTTKYFLKKHKRLHTGEMPYSCSKCNKTFTFQQSYHKHLLYHNDDKPHSCSHCGRSFKELSTLHNHQRIHTGEKPFSCESCGKCFRQRVSYLVHRRIHTGVMPYKCTACEKSFRYKVSQRTHKCAAQPPGTVIRQSGELMQKLIKNRGNDGDRENHPDEKVDKTFKQTSSGDKPYEEKKIDEKNVIDELINESIKRIDFSEPTAMSVDIFQNNNIYTMMPNEFKTTTNNGEVPRKSNSMNDGTEFDAQPHFFDVTKNNVYHDNSMFCQMYK